MSKPFNWGTGRLVAVKARWFIPTSREVALDLGMVEPTEAERAEIESRAAAARAWRAERDVERATAREHLAEITDPLARTILDLHTENERGECTGDDMDGYETEYPEWPCRTVVAVAKHYGIPLEAS